MKRLKEKGDIYLEVTEKGLYAIEKSNVNVGMTLLLTIDKEKALKVFEELAKLEAKLSEAREQGYTSIILVESNGRAIHYDDMRGIIQIISEQEAETYISARKLRI